MRERRPDRLLTRVLRLARVPALVLCLCALLLPGASLALQAPPPPPATPTFTPEPPTATFTPEPPTATFTPEPPTATFTPEPATSTFTPEPATSTFTPGPEAPTATVPSNPGPSATAQPLKTPGAEEPAQPAAATLCQSMVEGYVVGTGGQRLKGATVTIEGPGWSNGIMTDDDGRYGFAGLCASTATLRAFLTGNQAGPVAVVTLTGNNSLRQDLSFAASSSAPAAAAQASPGTGQPVPTAAAEAGMPVTGYTGWLLVGGAALGLLLLLSAGGRRVLQAYERVRGHE